MRIRPLFVLSSAALLACGTFWASAADKALPPVPVDDVSKLVKAGVGEDVLVAWAEALPPFATVDADTIIKLKDSKVPEKAIAALVRRGGQGNGPSGGEIREISRYEVPPTAGKITSRVESEEPITREAYTTDDAVRYTYVQPARTVYVGSDYYYPSYYSYPSYSYARYYPYSSYRSYPHVSFSFGSYPRYSSYGHYPYYRSSFGCYPSYRWGSYRCR